jgi:hypothetical protein
VSGAGDSLRAGAPTAGAARRHAAAPLEAPARSFYSDPKAQRYGSTNIESSRCSWACRLRPAGRAGRGTPKFGQRRLYRFFARDRDRASKHAQLAAARIFCGIVKCSGSSFLSCDRDAEARDICDFERKISLSRGDVLGSSHICACPDPFGLCGVGLLRVRHVPTRPPWRP